MVENVTVFCKLNDTLFADKQILPQICLADCGMAVTILLDFEGN